MQIRSENRDIPIVRNIRALRFPRPFFLSRMVFGLSPCNANRRLFTFKIMDVTSSVTPGIVENSCNTPSILTVVTAAPSKKTATHDAGVPHRGAKSSLKCLGRKSAECRGKSVLVDFHPHGDLKVFHRFNHDSPSLTRVCPSIVQP